MVKFALVLNIRERKDVNKCNFETDVILLRNWDEIHHFTLGVLISEGCALNFIGRSNRTNRNQCVNIAFEGWFQVEVTML